MEKCPLCMNTLPDGGEIQEKVFPHIPPVYVRHMAIRIMAFVSVVVIVSSFTISRFFMLFNNWFRYVLFGVISMWISLALVIRKRHNISKNIMWQVTVVSLLSILWDWATDWRGWSLEYLIPIANVSAMVVMYITAKAMRLSVRDYIAYFFLSGLFGIIPILFILFGWVNVVYPSTICVAVSIIFLSAILIFQGENIINELSKRMHI